MEKSHHADSWYSGKKSVLKPLLTFSPEDFELEHRLLCSKYDQLANDCVEAARNRGALLEI